MNSGPSRQVDETGRGQAAGPATPEAALRRRARSGGGRIAFKDAPDRASRDLGTPRLITFAEADAIADTLAQGFRGCGLRAGEVIAIQPPNTVDAALMILGAWRAGLAPFLMPLMWRLDEINRALSRVKPAAVAGVARYGEDRPAQTLGEAAARHMSVRYVFAAGDTLLDGVTQLDDWLDGPQAGENAAPPDPPAKEDISGETAVLTWAVSRHGSYPVPRTYAELMTLARLYVARLGLTGEDVVLNTYPYTSAAALAGQLVAPLLAGAETVLHLPFDFEVFLQQLQQNDITCTAVPAPVITALYERHGGRSGGLRLSRVACVWPSPHGVRTASGLFEPPVPIFDIHNFGELAVLVRARGAGADPSLLPLGKIYAPGEEEAGAPVLETRVRGSVKSGGERQLLAGSLIVRGGTVPASLSVPGGAAPETAPQPDAQGFLDTGIGCVVDDSLAGRFRCQKSEDVIYHGGAVVAARELDALYAEFPEFLDAAVFVLDDTVIGERIFAAVVPRPELSPSLERLRTFLAQKRVAPYKAPDQLVIVRSIPRNGDGTVQRDRILAQI